MKMGVVAALESELRGVVAIMSHIEVKTFNKIDFICGGMNGREIVAAVCGIGLVNAALATQTLLCYFPVESVINIGAAGALSPALDIGDVVVSRDVAYWENPQYMPQGGIYTADKALHDQCLAVCGHAHELSGGAEYAAGRNAALCNAVSGRVISGSAFVNKLSTRNRLRETWHADCVEMEGAAMGHTCYLAGMPFLIVRAVSDTLKHNGKAAKAAFGQNLAGAAEVLAEVVERMTRRG